MTDLASGRMLKSMRCLSFAACAALLLPSPSDAQQIPGRDLLQYPLGTLAEAPALATETGDGFQNPAAIRLPPGALIRGTVVALRTPTDASASRRCSCDRAASSRRGRRWR